jgi:hypothetical protein
VGGNFSISADCTGCGSAAGNGSAIHGVMYGDIWVCSGQSNMELPLIHDHYRNGTMDAVIGGRYSSIRMLEMGKNKLTDGQDAATGHDHFIVPPAPPGGGLTDGQMSAWVEPRVGAYEDVRCRLGLGPVPEDPNTPCPECCSPGDWGVHNWPNKSTTYTYEPNEQWANNTLWSFSSVCFNFAASLQDQQASRGENVVPIGLVGTYWGGTTIQAWLPNSTNHQGRCKDAGGNHSAIAQPGVDWGELYNGMILPLVNMSIRGCVRGISA